MFPNGLYSPLYENLGVLVPDNGASDTRCMLLLSCCFLIVGLIMIVSFFTHKLNLLVGSIYCVGSFFCLLTVFWKIFCYYRLLRRQKAAGVKFDPHENLSLANYCRVTCCLPPKNYPTRPARVKNANLCQHGAQDTRLHLCFTGDEDYLLNVADEDVESNRPIARAVVSGLDERWKKYLEASVQIDLPVAVNGSDNKLTTESNTPVAGV